MTKTSASSSSSTASQRAALAKISSRFSRTLSAVMPKEPEWIEYSGFSMISA